MPKENLSVLIRSSVSGNLLSATTGPEALELPPKRRPRKIIQFLSDIKKRGFNHLKNKQ